LNQKFIRSCIDFSRLNFKFFVSLSELSYVSWNTYWNKNFPNFFLSLIVILLLFFEFWLFRSNKNWNFWQLGPILCFIKSWVKKKKKCTKSINTKKNQISWWLDFLLSSSKCELNCDVVVISILGFFGCLRCSDIDALSWSHQKDKGWIHSWHTCWKNSHGFQATSIRHFICKGQYILSSKVVGTSHECGSRRF